MNRTAHSLWKRWSVWILGCVGAMGLWTGFSGCGKKKEKGEGPKAAPTETSSPDPRPARPGPDGQAARPGSTKDAGAAGAPVKINLSKDSATGLSECDTYLKKVCACAAKHTAMKVACEAAKRSAPEWKKSAHKDPRTIGTVRDSCVRAMQSITKTFGCK